MLRVVVLASGALFGTSDAWVQDPPARAVRLAELDAGFQVASWRVVAAGDGAQRVLAVGAQGELALFVEDGEGALRAAAVTLGALREAGRTLLDTGPLGARGGADGLFAADPAGLRMLPLVPPAPRDEAAAEASVAQDAWRDVARRARFDLRTGQPAFAPFLDDVNADGRIDAVLPGDGVCELWLAEAVPDGSAPVFSRAGRVRVEMTVRAATDADWLSNRLSGSFAIPGLLTDDLNGDGRPDLIVSDGARRGFHLQAEDGSFPVDPTVEVDLGLFRDTAAGDGGFRFGGTLAFAGDAQLQRRDLDGDSHADFVLSHGRKVWVFHGNERGPQFTEPSAILKTADDVTLLVVVRIDEDPYPDLLLLRVELPTIPTLLVGLFAEWDVKLRASGYRNLGGRAFELRPTSVRDLRLRVPPLFDVLRDPYAIVQRFQGVGANFRRALEGDFDGDGTIDLGLISETSGELEIWSGQGARDTAASRGQLEGILRDQLFGAGEDVWDLDRMLDAMSALADDLDRGLTDGRAPDIALRLRPPAEAGAKSAAPERRLGRIETVRPAGSARTLFLVEWLQDGFPPRFELCAAPAGRR